MKRYGIIYLLTCKDNQKRYVGQTRTTLEKRMSGHRYAANIGTSCAISRAIAKYGWDSFEVAILERPLVDDLDERERYWVAQYATFSNGYNLDTGGQKGNSIIDDAEAAAMLEQWNLGFLIPDIAFEFDRDYSTVLNVLIQYNVTEEERNARYIENLTLSPRKIVQIGFSGKIVKVHHSISSAARTFPGKAVGSIGACCNGHSYSAVGFYWRYFEDVNENDIVAGQYSGEVPGNRPQGLPRTYDYDEILKLWTSGSSQTEIAERIGCGNSTVSRVLRSFGVLVEDKQKRAAKTSSIPVIRTSPNNEIREYYSIKEAGRSVDSPGISIRRVIDKGTSFKGYRWEYKADYIRAKFIHLLDRPLEGLRQISNHLGTAEMNKEQILDAIVEHFMLIQLDRDAGIS